VVTRLIAGMAVATMALVGGSAQAHHSFAGTYDLDSPRAVEGSVQEFKFINPHVYIMLRIKGEDGRTVTWPLEGPSPASLTRDGWSIKSLKPGDQIKLTIWPMRNGEIGGVWYPMWTNFRDGRPIGTDR
jgi:hypothetical protein